MKLNLNGVEIELPNNAKVNVSQDGKKVKIEMPESEATEKIRVVEVPGPAEVRVVERIKVVEVEKPCTRPHYQPWTYPYVTWTYPTTVPYTVPYTITTSGNTYTGLTVGNNTGTAPSITTCS